MMMNTMEVKRTVRATLLKRPTTVVYLSKATAITEYTLNIEMHFNVNVLFYFNFSVFFAFLLKRLTKLDFLQVC